MVKCHINGVNCWRAKIGFQTGDRAEGKPQGSLRGKLCPWSIGQWCQQPAASICKELSMHFSAGTDHKARKVMGTENHSQCASNTWDCCRYRRCTGCQSIWALLQAQGHSWCTDIWCHDGVTTPEITEVVFRQEIPNFRTGCFLLPSVSLGPA